MFCKNQKLIFFLSFGLYVMGPLTMMLPMHTSTSNRELQRTPIISQLSDDDYSQWLRNQSARIIVRWKQLKKSISEKVRALKEWRKRTEPSEADAVNDEGEDSQKMKMWRATLVKLQRNARS